MKPIRDWSGLAYLNELRKMHLAARSVATRETNNKGDDKMNFDPSNPPSTKEAHVVISKIAEMLGVEPTHDEVQKALEQLFAAVTGDQDGSEQLSASEKKACTALGCSPRDFLALKKSTSMEAHQERARRVRAAASKR